MEENNMKLENKELLERLSTSRRAFNATAFAELDRNLSNGMSVTARVEYDKLTYFEYAMEALGVLFR